MNRRSFLEAAGMLVALPWTQAIRTSTFDPWIEIRPDHLVHNVSEVARAAGNRRVLAVIKNNGYGLGLVPVARVLSTLPQIYGLAVITMHEAMVLRDAGVTTPILLMGPFDERDLTELHAREIMPMVYTPVGDVLEQIAAAAGRPVNIHVCVDTGLGRVGVPFREATPLVRDLAGRRGVAIDGVMMTFTEDRTFDQEQLERFERLTGEWAAAGLRVGRRHAASSYTFFQHDNAWLDMVRPGMVLFGVYPEPGFRTEGGLSLHPAAALRTRVALVKKLGAGDTAGYGRAFAPSKDTWIATLPVGHADGWPRVAAKGAKVRINGRLYPVVASISASHTIVDIGPEPTVKAGDVATLWDWEDGSRPEDVAEACGASVYDLLMHLRGHLPRRVI